MTAPSWVSAALEVEGLEWSETEPSLLNPPDSTSTPSEHTPVHKGRWCNGDGKPSLVYTSTSKEQLAYTTCHKCPDPRRPHSELAPFFTGKLPGQQRGYRWETRYTRRCRKCNTTITRRMRAKRLLSDIQMMEDHLSLGVRWVTLTAPNYPCRDRGLIDFKKKVKRFRERKNYQSKVVGSAEFYEWTLHPDDRAGPTQSVGTSISMPCGLETTGRKQTCSNHGAKEGLVLRMRGLPLIDASTT